MVIRDLTVSRDTFAEQTGWALKPEGACRGDVCVPLHGAADGDSIDVEAVAGRLGMAIVADPDKGLWAIGPATVGGRTLQTAQAPDLVLPDLEGHQFRLSSLRGQKVLVLVWAPWCGCALDLPVWQRVRTELNPKGLEIVTVGVDTLGSEGCRQYIEAAAPEHPSLVDADDRMGSLFGVVNVPTGIWINEDGVLVRPPETAYAPMAEAHDALDEGLEGIPMPPIVEAAKRESERIPQYRDEYWAALVDWVANGAASRHALDPAAVVALSGVRDPAVGQAAAHFELAQHLWRAGHTESAYSHFRESHRLQPGNMAYKRQAWSLVSWSGTPYDRFIQGPVEGHEEEWPFEGDLVTEMRQIGPENFYPEPRLLTDRS